MFVCVYISWGIQYIGVSRLYSKKRGENTCMARHNCCEWFLNRLSMFFLTLSIHSMSLSCSFPIGALFAWHSSFYLIRFHLCEWMSCMWACARINVLLMFFVFFLRLLVLFFVFLGRWCCSFSVFYSRLIVRFRSVIVAGVLCYYFDTFLFVVVALVVFALMCSSHVIIMILRF